MDSSNIALLISNNALWIALIAIVGYLGYKAFEFYQKNDKLKEFIERRILKRKNGLAAKETTS